MIAINPADEFVVESPIAGKVKNFVRAYHFKKKSGWTKSKVKDWLERKFRVKPVISENATMVSGVISRNKSTKKCKIVPFHVAEGIYSEIGTVDANVKSNPCLTRIKSKVALENPGRAKKITLQIAGKVKSLASQGKTPKEINAILNELFHVNLAASTIHKLIKGTYIIPQKEVSVTYKNPMITEILENPRMMNAIMQNKALPLTMTNWFQTRVKALSGRGLSPAKIADDMNRELLTYIPDKYWPRGTKVRVGPKGSIGKGRIGFVITPKVVKRYGKKVGMFKSLPIPKQLRPFLFKKGEGGGKAFTSSATKKSLEQFTPEHARKLQMERIRKMQAARKSHPKPKVAAKHVKAKNHGKRRHVSEVLDMVGNNVMVGDLLNELSTEQLAQMPIEIQEVMTNPLYARGTLKSAFTKLGYQLPGVIAGAWALKITGGIANIITKIIPKGPVKNILNEVIRGGVVWGLAEAVLPPQFGVTANSIQTLALYRAASQILRFGKFRVVPLLHEKEEVAEAIAHEEGDIVDEVQMEVSDEVYDAWERGEITDEQVAQLAFSGKADVTAQEETLEPEEDDLQIEEADNEE